MAIGDDFSVDANGNIRHVSGTSTYAVLEMHRWLGDLADDAEASGNDIVDISRATPSDRSTDQIIQLLGNYNIDDDAAEYLYGGSIKQGTGDTETIYAGLKVLGAVNNPNTLLQVIQDHGYYNTVTPYWPDQSGGGLNGNATEGILMRILVKCRVNGCDIDGKRIRVQSRKWGDSYDFFNVTLGEGEAVAAIGTTPDAQNDTAIATVQAWSGGDIPTNTEGYQQIDLNNGNGNKPYYSKWTYNTNSAGLKAIWEWIKEITGNDSPEAAEPYDMNGELFLGITHSFAFDGGTGAGTQNEKVVWGTDVTYDTLAGGTFTVGNYVRFSGGAAGKVVYDNGTTQLKVALEDITKTISNDETITEYNKSTGATGVTAAVNVTVTNNDKEGGEGWLLGTTGTTTGSHYIQLLTGKAPVDNLPIRGMTSTNTWSVDGSVTARTVPKVFLGSYTGSLIGAYGVGVDPDDLTAADSVQELGGTTQYPPNNVIWTLGGLVAGDRVLVMKKHATNNDFDFAEMTLTSTLNGSGVTSVPVNAIPADAPQTGTLRITLDDGRVRRVPYLSWTGTTFTIASTDFTDPDDATSGNGVTLAFIDKAAASDTEQFTVKYNADRTLWVRVRDGGATPIKTYEAPSNLTSAGGAATATRIADA